MPRILINGVNLHYLMLPARSGITDRETSDQHDGQAPWIVLTPGGHQPLTAVLPLGEHLAHEGYRVLLHDRRNTGDSDVSIKGESSEQEIWANDLYSLLQALDIHEVIAGGGSAGCRLSLLLAVKNPGLVRCLLLWMVTGGPDASTILGETYYGQYIRMAKSGGMAEVCRSEFYAERISRNPANLEYLMSLNEEAFIKTMNRWRKYFLDGADLPVIGVTREELAKLDIPTCVVPGNDEIHPRRVALELCEILPRARLRYPFEKQERDYLKTQSPEVIQNEYTMKLKAIFTDFLTETNFP